MTQLPDAEGAGASESGEAAQGLDPAIIAKLAGMAIDRTVVDGIMTRAYPRVPISFMQELLGVDAMPEGLGAVLMRAVKSDRRYHGETEGYLEFRRVELSDGCELRPSMSSIILGRTRYATTEECESAWTRVNWYAHELSKLYSVGRAFTADEAYEAISGSTRVTMTDEEFEALKGLFSKDHRFYMGEGGEIRITSYIFTCQQQTEERIPMLRDMFMRVLPSAISRGGTLTTRSFLGALTSRGIRIPASQMSEFHSYFSMPELVRVGKGAYKVRAGASLKLSKSGAPRASEPTLAEKLGGAGIADRAVTPSVGKRSEQGKRTASEWGR